MTTMTIAAASVDAAAAHPLHSHALPFPTPKSVQRLLGKLGWEKEDSPQGMRLSLVLLAHLHGCDHSLWAEKV